jgi:uncharacterized protein
MRQLLPCNLLLLAVCFSCLAATGQTAEPTLTSPTIAVEAEGQVTAVPDLALLNLEVETKAPQAEAASQENSRRSDGLLKALKQGFPEDQVKTLGYRLSPVYAAKDKSSPPEIKGYQAVHRFQVKVKGPARLGAIIDLALKNGASGVSGPVWAHSRQEDLQREAAVAALERARHLAEVLAQAQGLKIKGVEKISTGLQYHPLRGAGEAMRLSAPAPPTAIEVGEEEIKASVQVVFQLQP